MRLRLIAIMLLGASLLAAPALASPSSVIADCNAHGKLTANYSDAELRAALSTMPADVKEYTGCYDVIQSRLLAQVGGSRPSGSATSSSSGSFLPTPVIVLLVVLALAAALLGALALRRRRAS